MAERDNDLFRALARGVRDLGEWVQDALTDPAVLAQIREDVGLSPDGSVPAGASAQLRSHLAAFDVDDLAFEATAEAAVRIVIAVTDIVDALTEPGADVDAIAYAIFELAAADLLRRRLPLVHALLVLAGMIQQDVEELPRFDPARLVGAVRRIDPATGEPRDEFGEDDAQRLAASYGLVIHATELIVELLTRKDGKPGLHPVRATFGWEPVPGAPTLTDQVAERTLTLVVGDAAGAEGALTMIVTTEELGGPGVFLSLGGQVTVEGVADGATRSVTIGAPSGLNALIRPGHATPFAAAGDLNAKFALDARPAPRAEAALRIGPANRTRLEVGRYELGLGVTRDSAFARLTVEKAELIGVLGEGDGFLAQLPGGSVRATADFSLLADTKDGLRVEGGAGLRAVLPVNASAFGVFKLHTVELGLGVSPRPRYDFALDAVTAFSLHLGPFTATVEGIGFRLDAALRKGNLGVMQVDPAFDPPNGIGLLLDAAAVRGGGFLRIDTERGEYSGALELSLRPLGLSIKAIGILTTRMPDGSDGWALLLLVYGTFPPIQLTWGFTLNGLGGAIGLQHGVDVGALQEGLRTGAMDAILFPADPVGNAPAIIRTLRAVFPVTPRALVIGPALELGWGTPSFVRLRLGVLLQFDDVLGAGASGGGLSRIVVLGQLRMELPPPEVRAGAPAVTQIVADLVGSYEVAAKRLMIVARLRDSHIARIELTGMLVIAADFGERPSFAIAAGGFHPRFTEVPSYLPAPIDRVGLKFEIGIVKVRLEAYVAVTPNSFQLGARLELSAKVWKFEIKGWLGFDALVRFVPRFAFRVDVSAGIVIRAFGRTLAGVQFSGALEGPGEWHLTGRASFEILWFEKTIDIDERWGSPPPAIDPTADVAEELRKALGSADAWSASLPAGVESLVTLAPLVAPRTVAHPQATLRVVEKVVPLGLEIARFGAARPSGARRFTVDAVTIGGTPATPAPVTELFARGEFLDLTDEQKLTTPSFERFPAGVEVGAPGHVAPPAEQCRGRAVAHEVVYLEPEPPGGRLRWSLVRVAGLVATDAEDLRWQSALGAAGRSALRKDAALGAVAPAAAVRVDPPAYTVVAGDGLTATGRTAATVSVASQAAGDVADAHVVESFELALMG